MTGKIVQMSSPAMRSTKTGGVVPAVYLILSLLAGTAGAGRGIALALSGASPADQGGAAGLHGLVMVCLVALPALIGGFGGLLLPSSLGLPGLRLPRVSLAGAGCLALSALLLATGGSPLASGLIWCAGVLCMVLPVAVSVMDSRAAAGPERPPLDFLAWSQMIAATALLLCIPAAAGELCRGTAAADIARSLMAPLSAAMMTAAAGVASLVLKSRQAQFSFRPMAAVMGTVVTGSALAWVHLRTQGSLSDAAVTDSLILRATLLTGAAFALVWGYGLWRQKLPLSPSVLWSGSFLVTLLAGQAGGESATHAVIMSGTLFALFAGLYLQAERLTGQPLKGPAPMTHVALVMLGTVLCAAGGPVLTMAGGAAFVLSIPVAGLVLYSVCRDTKAARGQVTPLRAAR
ncbi:hypothetical protein LOC54_04200 [Acetobacter sp. AN02]|uniref:hypothetical protein n=1 Tax=Acetobacter sp. AN02 TaxID=2894186 RepID=UPI0024341A45|nr:hypothetical protein [Acetobacter sp. AN02]MDG6094318.1 hypothetical protein [Acetobacter sp. AN02]